ncbi:hypothetical protein ZOD2009_20797 [Haladaptatus paucihalophilus DX253]|uniref:Uncharacterized protein n=1 Tax=Haladaptatus paucihalophilus DX253 TaxID=797209 RepID=E7QZF2_HALPU|nr:hypothetical protein ZOD2009_20797 [Haladaptatus paucihalophilus DX253]
MDTSIHLLRFATENGSVLPPSKSRRRTEIHRRCDGFSSAFFEKFAVTATMDIPTTGRTHFTETRVEDAD